MPTIFDASLRQRGIEPVLDLQTILSKPHTRRWHMAVTIVFCSRAFSCQLKVLAVQVTNNNETNKLSHVPSDNVIDVVETLPDFSNVDRSRLNRLVKQKDVGLLASFNGVLGLASSLKTSNEQGIHGDDADDISYRRQVFGTNTCPSPPKRSYFQFVWEDLKDFTILILLVCGALLLGFGIKKDGLAEGWYDGGSIFVTVFLEIAILSASNFRQNRQFLKLLKGSNNIPVEVVRSGRRQKIPIFKIVVGDIVFLKTGDKVPADGLFIDGHSSLQVDESSMTGGSDFVEVNLNQNPFLLAETKVVDGSGQMLVTSVRMNTTWDGMMSSITLQARQNKLTAALKVGLGVAFLALVVLLVRYFTGTTKDENGNKEFNGRETKVDAVINSVMRIVSAAVTIAVVAIPDGLPMAMAHAYYMKRMMADQILVRNLSACETMGSATVICVDKTGTLTLNQVKLSKFFLGHEYMDERGYVSIAVNVLELLHQGIGLNTTATIYRPSSGCEFEFFGSPTEKAILSWAVLELNMNVEELERNCTIVHTEAFNSTKKISGASIRKRGDNSISVHWKGAAEMILAMCSHYYDFLGNIRALDEVEKKKFDQTIQGMTASGLRCIAFAHKKVQEDDNEDREIQQKIEDSCLILLGLVGLKDQCMKKAVEDCQNAGMNIKMITADNVFTAQAVAIECGILGHKQDMDGAVVEGLEFRNYTTEERMEKVDRIQVMARSSSYDKLLMVQCLKEKGHVVAVTGDGINDAPALKEADIGLSMGIQGTEVAKESSDIVILDDSFGSIVKFLRLGRCVYNNIQKLFQFQLTANVAAIVINFVAAVSATEVPLTVVQLLWVNLIMYTLGGLDLATEKPTKELMKKRPVSRIKPLITNVMWRNLLAQAFYQIAILLTLQFRGESILGVNEKVNNTLIFNTFVLCQVYNEFNARKMEKKHVFEGIHRNKLFMGIVGIIIVLQVVMVEFLNKFADTKRLNWWEWGVCVGFAVMSWPIGWVVKCLPVPNKPFLSYLNLKC